MSYLLKHVLKSSHALSRPQIQIKTTYKYNFQARKLKKGVRGYTLVDHTQF